MKTLFLETSTEKSCLAIMDGSKTFLLPIPGGPELSKKLGMEVSNLLSAHSFAPDQIAAGDGPGSFTGTRVGLALAKALAFGWQIPLLRFCSMKTFAPTEDGPFAVLIDSRSSGIYMLKGERSEGIVSYEESPTLHTLQSLQEEIQHTPLLLSPHPEIIERRIKISCLEASPRFEHTPLYPPTA